MKIKKKKGRVIGDVLKSLFERWMLGKTESRLFELKDVNPYLIVVVIGTKKGKSNKSEVYLGRKRSPRKNKVGEIVFKRRSDTKL